MLRISPLAAARLEMWNCPCRLGGEWVFPGERCPRCHKSLVEILRWFWSKRHQLHLDR
jgi:hypothetical protein